MSKEIMIVTRDLKLPDVIESTMPTLTALTKALGIPRDVLASDEEISSAWKNLPRALQKIPAQLRTPAIAKMFVSVASGLFDSAINYMWNAAVVELRQKIQKFSLKVVQQLLGKAVFDEKALLNLKDAELLSLCLQLNLITEEGFFFLDQCRDVRNNFSAAHPNAHMIDDHEFIAFVSRCAKYALDNTQNPVGVDPQVFMTAIKANRFTDDQRREWVQRLSATHEAQRELLFGTLHGLYCDPASGEEARLNSLQLISDSLEQLTPRIESELINRHQDYIAKGIEAQHKASLQFFQKLGLTNLLSDTEQHAIIAVACALLLSVHQALDNFYNEPPFAKRLCELSQETAVPKSAQEEFVITVVTCAIGNGYGISNAAYPYYAKMIKNFSPAEVAIMLRLPASKAIVGQRIQTNKSCQSGFKNIMSLIDEGSIVASSGLKAAYEKWSKD